MSNAVQHRWSYTELRQLRLTSSPTSEVKCGSYVEFSQFNHDLSQTSAIPITDSLEDSRYDLMHAAESVKKSSRGRFCLARVQTDLDFGRLFLWELQRHTKEKQRELHKAAKKAGRQFVIANRIGSMVFETTASGRSIAPADIDQVGMWSHTWAVLSTAGFETRLCWGATDHPRAICPTVNTKISWAHPSWGPTGFGIKYHTD